MDFRALPSDYPDSKLTFDEKVDIYRRKEIYVGLKYGIQKVDYISGQVSYHLNITSFFKDEVEKTGPLDENKQPTPLSDWRPVDYYKGFTPKFMISKRASKLEWEKVCFHTFKFKIFSTNCVMQTLSTAYHYVHALELENPKPNMFFKLISSPMGWYVKRSEVYVGGIECVVASFCLRHLRQYIFGYFFMTYLILAAHYCLIFIDPFEVATRNSFLLTLTLLLFLNHYRFFSDFPFGEFITFIDIHSMVVVGLLVMLFFYNGEGYLNVDEDIELNRSSILDKNKTVQDWVAGVWGVFNGIILSVFVLRWCGVHWARDWSNQKALEKLTAFEVINVSDDLPEEEEGKGKLIVFRN